MGPGGEGENPREGKAHEGRGLWFGLIRRPEERTLAGSKALKWRPSPKGLRQQKCRGMKWSSTWWIM
jgi:hypothetical protein